MRCVVLYIFSYICFRTQFAIKNINRSTWMALKPNDNMAASHLRGDVDYHELFDPKAYLNRYFAEPMVHITFALDTVHQIYNTGGYLLIFK